MSLASYSPNTTAHEETPEHTDLEKAQDEPKANKKQEGGSLHHMDQGYAWVVCVSVILLYMCTWGTNSCFSIYFANYLTTDSFPGATKMDYAYIGGMAFGIGMSFSTAITVILGVIGLRSTLIFGNCLQFAALMLASWTTKLWQLYLTQGLMQSFGLAFVAIPAMTLLPQWFKRRRVLATGLGAGGAGLGGIVFNLGMQKVVDTKGVFWALRAQSIIAFGLTWIAIFLVRDNAKSHGIKFNFFEVSCMKFAGFWMLILFTITCVFGYVIVLYTLANFTTSLGYSEQQGAIVTAMIHVGSLFGRPAIGFLADKFGGATVGVIAYYVAGIFCLGMWIPARNYATCIIFALIQGALMGTIYTVIAPIVARIFGIRKMNVAFAQVFTFMGISGIFGPVIGVKLTKGSGATVFPSSYRDCSIFTGVMFITCATILLIIRGYIKARDRELVAKGDAATDMDHAENPTVSPVHVFESILARDGEKA
ncbi:uncharacterized protein LODBEIA_P03040 [Lodderomyces beijingensis]|uniref:Major facilitator superfamily (MFS) profile domain-containing protein n=1 Tax=Lodderomyces beijingensis TaxID=1775926 RepID=A0ABP0ZFX6_9ASCO